VTVANMAGVGVGVGGTGVGVGGTGVGVGGTGVGVAGIGVAVGAAVGPAVGASVGPAVGTAVGTAVGAAVLGLVVGVVVGLSVGVAVGAEAVVGVALLLAALVAVGAADVVEPVGDEVNDGLEEAAAMRGLVCVGVADPVLPACRSIGATTPSETSAEPRVLCRCERPGRAPCGCFCGTSVRCSPPGRVRQRQAVRLRHRRRRGRPTRRRSGSRPCGSSCASSVRRSPLRWRPRCWRSRCRRPVLRQRCPLPQRPVPLLQLRRFPPLRRFPRLLRLRPRPPWRGVGIRCHPGHARSSTLESAIRMLGCLLPLRRRAVRPLGSNACGGEAARSPCRRFLYVMTAETSLRAPPPRDNEMKVITQPESSACKGHPPSGCGVVDPSVSDPQVRQSTWFD
jgi:hypothetical protein